MIKGTHKSVYILQNPHSEIYEQAIFVVKPSIPPLSDYTLRSEAERILEEATGIKVKKKNR